MLYNWLFWTATPMSQKIGFINSQAQSEPNKIFMKWNIAKFWMQRFQFWWVNSKFKSLILVIKISKFVIMVFRFRLWQYRTKTMVEITPHQFKSIQMINFSLRKSWYWRLLGVVKVELVQALFSTLRIVRTLLQKCYNLF